MEGGLTEWITILFIINVFLNCMKQCHVKINRELVLYCTSTIAFFDAVEKKISDEEKTIHL